MARWRPLAESRVDRGGLGFASTVADQVPSLSTHVLDAAAGGPRPGIAVAVFDESGAVVATATTDEHGRVEHLAVLAPGSYRIRWTVGGPFLAEVTATVTLDDDRRYHVPLLSSGSAAVVYLGA